MTTPHHPSSEDSNQPESSPFQNQPDSETELEQAIAEDQAAAAREDSSLFKHLQVAQADALRYKETYLRTLADLENFRRRVAREKEELRRYAVAQLLEDLLPTLDNLNLGLKSAQQAAEAKTIADGFLMVANQLKMTLERHGLKEVNPEGAPFDPNLHECIAHQACAQTPKEHVIAVVRSGYTLNDRLLRPASVLVSSGA